MISAWWLLLIPVGSTLGFLGCALLRKPHVCAICSIRAAWYCDDCVARACTYSLPHGNQKGD
jgi:hypothetical protein